MAAAAGADAAPGRDRAGPARRALPRQAGPGAGRVAPHGPLAAQARQPHPGRPALPACRARTTRLRAAARGLKPAHRVSYADLAPHRQEPVAEVSEVVRLPRE